MHVGHYAWLLAVACVYWIGVMRNIVTLPSFDLLQQREALAPVAMHNSAVSADAPAESPAVARPALHAQIALASERRCKDGQPPETAFAIWNAMVDPRYKGDCANGTSVPHCHFGTHIAREWCSSVSPWQFPELLPSMNLTAPRNALDLLTLTQLTPFAPDAIECNPRWWTAEPTNREGAFYTAFVADGDNGTVADTLFVTVPRYPREGITASFPALNIHNVSLGYHNMHLTMAAVYATPLPEQLVRDMRAGGRVQRTTVSLTVGKDFYADIPVCYLRAPRPQRYLTVCTIFRDDALWLVEWLEWHFMVGVEHVILYDHASTDMPQLLLEPYVRAGLVTVLPWPFRPEPHTIETYQRAQVLSELDCLLRFRTATKYMAVVDTDEYLLPIGNFTDVRSVLRHLETSAGLGSTRLSVEVRDFEWQDHELDSRGGAYRFQRYRLATKLMLDKYRYKRRVPKTVKSIGVAAAVQGWDIHTVVTTQENYRALDFPLGIEIMHHRVERYGHGDSRDYVHAPEVAQKWLSSLRARIANGTSQGLRLLSENIVAIDNAQKRL